MNTILPNDLKTRMKTGEPITLLDVREKDELTGELGHIPGVVHIPLGELPLRMQELEENKNQPLVTICKMGGRAAHAGEFLQQAGFTNVILLTGGMIGWNECGLPVKTGSV
jgi:rhodanese-related sulfurtransferase